MTFWIICALLFGVLLAALSVSLFLRRAASADPASYDLQVYRDQLKEVDRDLARGILSAEDADRVRTEVSRRILAADATHKAEIENFPSKQPVASAFAIIILLLAFAFPLYTGAPTILRGLGLSETQVAGVRNALTFGDPQDNAFSLFPEGLGAPGYGDLALADRIEHAETLRLDRPAQADAEASLPAPPLNSAISPDYVALVNQLRTAIADRPNDLEGHRLLANAEARLGNFADAHRVQSRVLSLLGDNVTADDFMGWADMMILAAGGYVSPEAERALSEVLARDDTNGSARYYWGLMLSQTGRPDSAFRIWDGLLRQGPADAPWIPPIVAQIEDMAVRAGVRYTLPDIGTGRGPSAGDIEAAESLSPAERMEMIQGMVGRLSDRLATEGGPPEDWAQLISALAVLGRMDDARAIFDEARSVFASAPTALDMINRAADRAGLL